MPLRGLLAFAITSHCRCSCRQTGANTTIVKVFFTFIHLYGGLASSSPLSKCTRFLEKKMKYRLVVRPHNKAREKPSHMSVSGGKPCRCIVMPSNAAVTAETLERRNHSLNKARFIVVVDKLPMVSRSSYLNRLVFDRSNCERDSSASIQIDDLPGGPEIFELVVKFCYGWQVDLTAANVAPLYCAAHFLEMSEDLEPGNLLSKASAFLSFTIFSSWKDIFRILKSCESISSWARELQIPKYCSEAVAWKACTDPRAISSGNDDAQCIDILANNSSESNLENATETWWFEDVSNLRIDHFIEVIASIEGKRMRPELVGSCVAYWTSKWLSLITFRNTMSRNKDATYQAQRITIECLISILPVDQNSVAFNFLLCLLKVAVAMKINPELLIELETRTAFTLERCHPQDLLIKNGGDEDPIHDVALITRVIRAYISSVSRNPASKTFAVGRLVDEYLALVAKDEKLKAKDFQSLAEALPKRSRHCNDNLYRAIDMFLKAHPNLTEEERAGLCKAMDYHKLSREAQEHMMKNDILPLSFTTPIHPCRASKHGKVYDCSGVQLPSEKIPENNES